jgi:amino acid transporter
MSHCDYIPKRFPDVPMHLGLSVCVESVLIKRLGIAEMVTFLPISSPFIRFAGRFFDDAFGVAAGWNFFVFEAALVPFEIVACNVIIGFWSDAVPTGAIIAIVIVLYGYDIPRRSLGNSK